jgi:hypothetical protein
VRVTRVLYLAGTRGRPGSARSNGLCEFLPFVEVVDGRRVTRMRTYSGSTSAERSGRLRVSLR